MINIRRFISIIIISAISMSVFCQKIDKIDRSKQRTEKTKSSKTSKGTTTNSSTKQQSQTQATPKKQQSQTANSTNKNSPNQQTTKRIEKPYLKISSNTAYFVYDGGSCTFQIQSNNSWSIKVKTADWGQLERNGNTLTLRVVPNKSDKSRADYFIISSGDLEQKVNISQSGNPNFAPYLNASSTSLTFSSTGGSKKINITSNRDWKIKTGTTLWGHLQRDGNNLIVSVDANKSTSQRTDYFVLIADGVERRVDITQYAGTSSSYNSTYSSYSSSYYGSNSYKSYARRRWWKKNFSVGIEADFETNINSESGADMFYSAGLLFRFGNCQQIFSVTTGVKYRWLRVMPESGNNYYSDVEWHLFGGSVVVPLYLRFNFARLSSNCKMFLGLGGEFGAKVFPSSGSRNMLNDYYYSLSPQLGFFWRHFEMAFYWKMYPQSPFNSYYSHYEEYKCNSMLGMSMSIYF